MPSAAEQEPCVGEGIQPELQYDRSKQTFNTESEVGATAGDYAPVSASEIRQHDFRTCSTVSTVAASTPL